MGVMSIDVARYTARDLAEMPQDDVRREIIDGQLFVTPSPTADHQRVVVRLWRAFDDSCQGTDYEAFVALLDVLLSEDTVLVPDVLVALRSSVGAANLPGPPALICEVRSPGTARRDRTVKAQAYARAGVEWYLLADPQVPSLEVLRLRAGVYEQVTPQVSGTEQVTLELPWAVVTLRPADLLGSRV